MSYSSLNRLITTLITEELLDLGVVGVEGDVDGRVMEDNIPDALSEERAGDGAGVETIRSLDQETRIVALTNEIVEDGVEDLHVINVGQIEVLPVALGLLDDLGIDVGELGSVGGGGIAHAGVSIEPASTRGDLDAVEVVVEVAVRGAAGVGLVTEDVEAESAVHEAAEEDVGVGGEGGVEVLERGEGALVELLGLGHGGDRAVLVADIVTDEGEEGEDGVVGLLVASDTLDDAGGSVGGRAGTVDADVLVVAVRAAVEVSHALVEGVELETLGERGTVGAVAVAGGGAAERPVSLVGDDAPEVGVGAVGDLGRVEPVGGDGEVGGGAVAEAHDAILGHGAEISLLSVGDAVAWGGEEDNRG